MIKTFRGKLGHGLEERIRLSTKQGKIGYRIVKFECMNTAPGTQDSEFVTKVFKITQTSDLSTIDALVDFSDGNLLAVNVISNTASPSEPYMQWILFDREIFNQDLFITTTGTQGSPSGTFINYYIELETMTLSDNAASLSTLRDVRRNPQVV